MDFFADGNQLFFVFWFLSCSFHRHKKTIHFLVLLTVHFYSTKYVMHSFLQIVYLEI